MIDFLTYIASLVIGFLLMIKSADIVTNHASNISKKRGISEMTIGMTLVALATSLPELAISSTSAFVGKTDIALGNVIGSNITNVALVLGLCAIIRSISIEKRVVGSDGAWMLIATFITSALLYFGDFGRIDGLILLLIFVAFLYFLRKTEKGNYSGAKTGESALIDVVWSLGGGVLVWIGSWIAIFGVEGFANYFGIKPIYIALTIVALGTSLPELIVSIVAITKDLKSISVGNILGSNIFNLLLVLGISSIIRPILVDSSVLSFYVPIMIISSLLCVLFMRTKWTLERWEGFTLLLIYIAFISLIFKGF